VLVKADYDFDALRAVMQLMQPAPQKQRSVTPAMPPVIDECKREMAEQRSARHE